MADVLAPSIAFPTPPELYDAQDQREFRRIITERLTRPTRDTIPLTCRARITATGATTVTVRVAVADPEPQGTDSVSITHAYLIASGAGTVDLSSPQTVTPQATLTEAAGTYKDYVVTRPAANTGSGRITFTAEASNRVSDVDAVDVPAVDTAGTIYSEVRAAVSAVTATTIDVTVTAVAATGTPTVHLVAITGTATLNAGPAVGATGQASGTTWTFNRGPALGGSGQVQFRATLGGTQTDDDFVTIPEIGQDTIYLATRARVTASDDTTVTVRVAVADPYPQGANSATIAYAELGLGASTSPATGQTVTPAATLTEAAGTYVDYTVTRPAAFNGTGRITFTVTAANRVSDSDAVDVPATEQTSFGPSLDVQVTPRTPTAAQYRLVATYTGTMTYKIDGGSDNNGTGSPQTIDVTRPDYLGDALVYVFKCVKDAQTVTDTVVVPPLKDNSAASFSIGVQTGDDTTERYYYSWTATGFPSGTTFNLLYKYTNTAATLVEEGTVVNATSGDYITSGGNIGSSPTYVMTVDAVNGGVVLNTVKEVGTFVT